MIEDLLESARLPLEDDALRERYATFMSEPEFLAGGGVTTIVNAIAQHLFSIDDPFHRARLALRAGIAIEQGGPVEPLAPTLARLLRECYADLEPLLRHALASSSGDGEALAYLPDHPRAVRAWLGARYCHLAAMTTWCRSVPGRIAARGDSAFMDGLARVKTSVPLADYVHALLSCADDVRFVLLHRGAAMGWQLVANGIQSLSQLLVLTQACLPSNVLACDELDMDVVRYARGRLDAFPDRKTRTGVLSLDFGPAAAAVVDTVEFRPRIHAAAPFEVLPTIEGTPILLAWKPTSPQRWSTHEFPVLHGAYEANVNIERELSASEVDAWFRRIERHYRDTISGG